MASALDFFKSKLVEAGYNVMPADSIWDRDHIYWDGNNGRQQFVMLYDTKKLFGVDVIRMVSMAGVVVEDQIDYKALIKIMTLNPSSGAPHLGSWQFFARDDHSTVLGYQIDVPVSSGLEPDRLKLFVEDIAKRADEAEKSLMGGLDLL